MRTGAPMSASVADAIAPTRTVGSNTSMVSSRIAVLWPLIACSSYVVVLRGFTVLPPFGCRRPSKYRLRLLMPVGRAVSFWKV